MGRHKVTRRVIIFSVFDWRASALKLGVVLVWCYYQQWIQHVAIVNKKKCSVSWQRGTACAIVITRLYKHCWINRHIGRATSWSSPM